MICTEEEAKSKWCPKFHGGSGSNRWHYGEDCRVHEQTCCLGSACMWWEWGEGDPTDNDSYNGSRQGYCGRVGHRPLIISTPTPELGLKR